MDLAALLQSLEGPDFEAKAAQGGLPNDLWETYSAFANTNGGAIVLGLREEADRLVPLGLSSPARMRKALFDGLNNRNKVSVNILREEDVTIDEVEGKRLLVIRVPDASRKLKPVYINNDPMRGTFRRLGNADYRCSEEMMRRMWAENIDVRDSTILNGFGLSDLDLSSLAAYRTLFLATAPDHPWQTSADQQLLTNLGGWRQDRDTTEEGLTLAGLVMFGRERPLLDALPPTIGKVTLPILRYAGRTATLSTAAGLRTCSSSTDGPLPASRGTSPSRSGCITCSGWTTVTSRKLCERH